jgi:hypothetical protein
MLRAVPEPLPVDWWARAIVVLVAALLVSLAYALVVILTASPDDRSPSSTGMSIEGDGVTSVSRPDVPVAPVANVQRTSLGPSPVDEDDLDNAVAGVYANIKPVAVVLIMVAVDTLVMVAYLIVGFRRLRQDVRPIVPSHR